MRLSLQSGKREKQKANKKHKTFELDKPSWIAALMDTHKRKEK